MATPDLVSRMAVPTKDGAVTHWVWSGTVILTVLLWLLSGCTATRPAEATPDPEALHAAYRAGLEAALRGYQEQLLDNDFPYYNWSPPLVQRLWVPPRITGGVFIPGHMDDVIVKPGAWKREFSAPLSTHQPLSQTRTYTRERVVGAADRPRSAPSADRATASLPVPPAPRTSMSHPHTPETDWAELPAPGEQWRAR
ncbi:MAG: hypothetical protein HOP18_19375 [Deltaproteobacteria bacterium]|nr:hypothetical protein [Deltaproteobacteria bacterium]